MKKNILIILVLIFVGINITYATETINKEKSILIKNIIISKFKLSKTQDGQKQVKNMDKLFTKLEKKWDLEKFQKISKKIDLYISNPFPKNIEKQKELSPILKYLNVKIHYKIYKIKKSTILVEIEEEKNEIEKKDEIVKIEKKIIKRSGGGGSSNGGGGVKNIINTSTGNTSTGNTSTGNTVLDNNKLLESIIIGSSSIKSTPIEKATKFASAYAIQSKGDGTFENPYYIKDAINSLVPGDVLFLRGGVYEIDWGNTLNIRKSGTEDKPIIIESYPGENAIFDGLNDLESVIKNGISSLNYSLIRIAPGVSYIYIRKIEVKRMGKQGIYVGGRFNIIEGCVVHDNLLTGIQAVDGENSYTTPYINGWNIIRNNIIYNNSGAGITNEVMDDGSNNVWKDGDNSDGISVSSGEGNIIEYNTIYANSDDGIDVWRSNDTIIRFNKVYDNGRGLKGNGNGIKMGGNTDKTNEEYGKNGLRAYTHNNLSFNNKSEGFDANGGKNLKIEYNTAYNNGKTGFGISLKTIVKGNISVNNNINDNYPNGRDDYYPNGKNRIDNSWQTNGDITFKSLDINDNYFLYPKSGTELEKIGAYHINEFNNFNDIQELIKDSIDGINNNVVYIVSGDSTRNNIFNEMIKYYTDQLSKANITIFNNAQSGQTGENWKNNNGNATIEKAILATKNDGENTILEFSFGINDFKIGETKEKIKLGLKDGIVKYIREKPKSKVFLVTPVTTKNKERNIILKEIYEELAKELNLPLVDISLITSMIHSNSDYYFDGTHPNKFGSRRIVNFILSEIGEVNLFNTITLEEYPILLDPINIRELDFIVENGYWGSTTANPVSTDNWRRLSTIEVQPNVLVKIKHSGNRNDVNFLDENFNFILNKNIKEKDIDGYMLVAIPKNAKYIRINISSDGENYDLLNDIISVKYSIDDRKYLSIEEINKDLGIRLKIK